MSAKSTDYYQSASAVVAGKPKQRTTITDLLLQERQRKEELEGGLPKQASQVLVTNASQILTRSSPSGTLMQSKRPKDRSPQHGTNFTSRSVHEQNFRNTGPQPKAHSVDDRSLAGSAA
jgi:hypothetical protein